MQVAGLPPRSMLASLCERDAFCWATGIEDTVIVDPWPQGGRTLDEYALTDHYRRREEDLRRVIELGVGAVRYGVPWHRANPAPGRFDWSDADAAFPPLLGAGVTPIVDLVHYGTPRWLEGGFLDPAYPERIAEYAAALAQRFRGRLRWFTPFNEPRIAAWYCGRLGWWPPYGRSWSGFARVLLAACRGIAATQRALHRVDPEIVIAHVDATDLYEPADPGAQPEAALRQELVFLALDLVSGRVDRAHPLHGWLRRHGASEALLERLAGLYFERYRRPLFVTETAALGRRRPAWLAGSVEAVRSLRAGGIPLVGYTWWPLFPLVAWAYRQGRRPLEAYFLPMGLY